MNQLRSRLMLRDYMLEVTAGNLPYVIPRSHDDRKLFRVMFLPPSTIADKDREKSAEAIGLIRAGRFQMPTKRLRANIDTKDRLRLGAHRLGTVEKLASSPSMPFASACRIIASWYPASKALSQTGP